jgi:hypothetical protein
MFYLHFPTGAPERLKANQDAAVNRRPAGQSDGSDNLSAIVAADRVFPAAVAELDRWVCASLGVCEREAG